MHEELSWIVFITTMLCIWVTGRHRWGWFLSSANEGLWVALGLHTHSPGIVVLSVVCFFLFARNGVLTYRR